MVLKLGTNIEVAGAQFVESGDTLDEVQAIIRDNLRDALPGKKIQTELGRKKLNVDYCISFTGNAGPSAMENKPVGEVYIGLATPEKVEAYPYQLEGDRNKIQEKAIILAFTLLENALRK